MSDPSITAAQVDCQAASLVPPRSLASDILTSGQRWALARREADLIAAAYSRSDSPRVQKWAQSIGGCARALAYSYEPQHGGGYRRTLVGAKLCRVRTCPICQWRRSLRLAAQQGAALAKLTQDGERAAVMLTLTVRNCDVSELRATIKQMLAGWGRLCKRTAFAAVSHWVRSVEVTPGRRGVRGDCHPHMHTLLVCPVDEVGALLGADWAALWRDVCRLDYTPVVDVRPIVGDGGPREVLKYAVKPSAEGALSGWLERVALEIDGLRLFAASQSMRGAMSDELPADAAEDDEVDTHNIVPDLPAGLSPRPARPVPVVLCYGWVSSVRHYMRHAAIWGMSAQQYRYSVRVARGDIPAIRGVDAPPPAHPITIPA